MFTKETLIKTAICSFLGGCYLVGFIADRKLSKKEEEINDLRNTISEDRKEMIQMERRLEVLESRRQHH